MDLQRRNDLSLVLHRLSYWFSLILGSVLLGMTGCETYTSTFRVVRVPEFRADVGGELWEADRYEVIRLGQSLYFDDSLHQDGTLFHRLLIIGYDRASELKRLQITLDVANIRDMRGSYTPRYTAQGGLNAVEWVRGTLADNNLRQFALCPAADNTDSLKIERQSLSEGLIAGTFQAKLCAQTDTISMSLGVFKDLNYEE